jgi:hypothetical protein
MLENARALQRYMEHTALLPNAGISSFAMEEKNVCTCNQEFNSNRWSLRCG